MNGTVSGAVVAEGTSVWYKEITPAKEGAGTIYVCAEDNAGNISSWITEDFFYDTASPTITSGTGARIVTSAATIIVGTASDNSGIAGITVTQNKDGGGAVQLDGISLDGQGSWTISGLPRKQDATSESAPTNGTYDGTYSYVITATDNAGKATTLSRTIVFDNTAPEAEITSPTDEESIEVSTKTFKGTAKDETSSVKAIEYELKKGESVISRGSTNATNGTVENGITIRRIELKGESWNVNNVSLGDEEGTFTLSVTTEDEAGNRNEQSINRTFFVDKNYPEVTETTVGDTGLTTKNAVTLSGLIYDSNELDNTTALKITASGYTGAKYIGLA